MTPVVRPDLAIQLKTDHTRMLRLIKLVRMAAGPDQELLAMQGLLLEIRRSIQGLVDVANEFSLPLDELVLSHLDSRAAELDDMLQFFPASTTIESR